MTEEKTIMVMGVNYIVSSDGKVYSTSTSGASYYHKEIAQRLNADGYLQVTVGTADNRTQYRVHRMVAEAFIPNPDNLPEVNHKDYNRTNNNVENLEWSTHADNVAYSAEVGHYSHFGDSNSNYGNDILSKRYAADKELSRVKNGRPGIKNGRCRKVILINIETQDKIYFDYTRQASQYLIDNGYTKANDINSVSNRIALSIKSNTVFYKKFRAEFVD